MILNLFSCFVWFGRQGHQTQWQLRVMVTWIIFYFMWSNRISFIPPLVLVGLFNDKQFFSSFWRSREAIFNNNTEGCCSLLALQAKINLQMQAVNAECSDHNTCLWWFLYRGEHCVMSAIKKLLPLSPNGHIIISKHFI